MPTKKKSPSALAFTHRRYFAGKPERLAELEEARASAAIARQVYALRIKAGLTLLGNSAGKLAEDQESELCAGAWAMGAV